MSEEILINVTPQETRVAVVENGVLQEVHIERAHARGIVGNVYKGRVARVLPGMQAAFVDVGLERTGFLHVSDVCTGPDGSAREAVPGVPPPPIADDEPPPSEPRPPSISALLQDGQEVVVQVVKDPLGAKGARLTMQISFPARYLVYVPYRRHIGISHRIADAAQRERLRALVSAATATDDGGYILRTLAESATAEEIGADVRYLRRVWSACRERLRTAGPARLLHEDLPLTLRTMRDLVRGDVEKIRIDSREIFARAREFAVEFIPEVADRIEYYPGEHPIFGLYSVEDEIEKALNKRVPLKSGGHLVIDQTEAMTAIDVNTGTYVGRHNPEETLFKTNLEAAQTVARQLRLRNLGGMIIIDFIDMADAEHRRQVLRVLEKALARDRTRVCMTEMSSLGLVELTRKRTHESLEHVLCQPCPACQGRGMLKTPQTVCYEIFRETLRQARQHGAGAYLVLASPAVIDRLVADEAGGLATLQELIGKAIQLKAEPLYSPEQYDVVPL